MKTSNRNVTRIKNSITIIRTSVRNGRCSFCIVKGVRIND
nr:MAG TPA: HEPN/RES N-terminal domain 1 [Caudoviricetes sp.]